MRRAYKEVRDAALREAAEYWVRELLPEHFRPGAEARYRYARRTEAHLRRKRREGKGTSPNVYTGRLRDKMLSMEPRMTITARGMVLRWPGLPKYTYVVDTMQWVANDRRWNDAYVQTLPPQAQEGIMKWRRAHPETQAGRFKLVKRPDKVAEITTVTAADAKAVGKVFRSAFLAGMRAMKKAAKKTK
jgi:hypothetical protein